MELKTIIEYKEEKNLDIFEDIDKKVFDANMIDYDTLTRMKYSSLNDFHKSKKRKRKCVFPGCNNNSIKKSHTIPKSASLKTISTNGHLLQPYLDIAKDELSMIMEKIGIGEATVFSGFCDKHEMIFAEYEQNKSIESIEHGYLQIYRTICREIVTNKLHLENIIKSIVKYQNERNRKYKLEMESKFNRKIEEVRIKYDDYRLKSANITKVKLKEKIEFLNKVHDKFFESIKHKKYNENIFIRVIVIQGKQFPIALSGLGYATFNENENNRVVISILNVIPQESSTVLILAGDNTDEDILEKCYEDISQNAFYLLNFIESYMMHGTDHWFIRPEVWDRMDEKKQKYMLDYIFTTEKSFLGDLDFSIFDDLRKELIETCPLEDSYKKSEVDKFNFSFKSELKTYEETIKERYINFYEENNI